MKTAERK